MAGIDDDLIRQTGGSIAHVGYTTFRVCKAGDSKKAAAIVFRSHDRLITNAIGLTDKGILVHLFAESSITHDCDTDRFTINGMSFFGDLQPKGFRVVNAVTAAARLLLEADAWVDIWGAPSSSDLETLLGHFCNERDTRISNLARSFMGTTGDDPEHAPKRFLTMLAEITRHDTELCIQARAMTMRDVYPATAETWNAELAASRARQQALTEALARGDRPAALVFMQYKQEALAAHCAVCHPLVAKKSIGGNVIPAMIKGLWEGCMADMWTTFLVRRWFLQYEPKRLYVFYILNIFGVSAMCSQEEDVWGNLYQPTHDAHREGHPGLGALRGMRPEGNNERSFRLYCKPALQNKKRLGETNAMVAESFRAALHGVAQPHVVPDTLRQVLVRCGWVRWFHENFMLPLHELLDKVRPGATVAPDDLFDKPAVFEQLKAPMMRVRDARHAWEIIQGIAESVDQRHRAGFAFGPEIVSSRNV